MRTNIDINDKLIKEALRLSEASTKKEIVNIALQYLVDYLKRQQLLSLRGKVKWTGNLDQMRTS